MTLDLGAIRARAMILRDVRGPREERSKAILQADEDMLDMADEIERLRACLSPEAADLAEKLRRVRLRPIPGEGPVYDLHAELSRLLARFVEEHGPKAGKPPTWDLFVGTTTVRMMVAVDRHLQAMLGKT